MKALQYAFTEAAASLSRGRRNAILAVLTIAAGLFVLGFFLVVQTNLRQVVARWSEAAELSVYLADDVSKEQLQSIGEQIDASGLSASRDYVSKADAAKRFRQDFPDLAGTADRLERNPFPASFEVRLKPEARVSDVAVDGLADSLSKMRGVADIRYDRRLLGKLNAAIGFVRGIGVLIVAMLALAAALTVANVVRLAAYARREEIEIMQLVGAPLAYVRGPFVAEGVLQGGAGALLALGLLTIVYFIGKARFGRAAAEALGLGSFSFIPAELWFVLLVGGMLLGCLGGFVVARAVK